MLFTFTLPVSGHTVQYKVQDRLRNVIQDWTSDGIEQRTIETDNGTYEYAIDYRPPSETFKGDILWKSITDSSFFDAIPIGY